MSSWKECKLGDVVSSNNKTVDKNYEFENIQYLDTGSLTNNKIDSFQEFKINEAPSQAKRLVKHQDIVYSTVRPIQRHFGFFKDESLENESWWVSNDVSSIRSPRKLLYFIYNIISNPVHGKYLKAIEISPVLKPSPWQRRNDDESNMNNSIWHKTLDNFLSSGELEYIQKKFPFFDSSLTLFDCLKKLHDVDGEPLYSSGLPDLSQRTYPCGYP